MDKREKLEKFGLYDPRFEHDSCGVGFVCDLKGAKSNEIVKNGLEILRRLSHRGAVGADPKTGDGAGILIQMPHEFMAKAVSKSGFGLPAQGGYGTGLVFLPTKEKERRFCKAAFSAAIQEMGQSLAGWREVPVDDSQIGNCARDTQPVIEQVFILKDKKIKPGLDFERKLYLIRKQVENEIRASKLSQKSFFYITNLSCRTFSYKGLLMPEQLEGFFPDLSDPSLKSCLALVHSRYSTNTFPTWDLSQPFRFLAHNGEINTLRGNINWMRAKEGLLESELFGRDISKLKPVVVPGGSDSAGIDNVFELLVLSGRSLPHAMMMLIPSAWEQDNLMDKNLRAFYKYHACLMEPWDGPAAIAFTDGSNIGAVLDRNGLRPARYLVTKSGKAIMASEAGVLDVNPADIAYSGRLEPGKIFFIDTEAGTIIDDAKVKKEISAARPYKKWAEENIVELEGSPRHHVTTSPENTLKLLKAFGYTREDMKFILKPMAETAQEPVGSMGNDTPHAVLSGKPQPLFSYFKQLFAQVTNPAIDSLREELVMGLDCFMGPRKNLLAETAQHCRKVHLKTPIVTNEELRDLRSLGNKGFKSKTISITFALSGKDKAQDKKRFKDAIENICKESAKAVTQKVSFIVLSDRGVDKAHAAIPSLLAIGAVHRYLVDRACRSQVALILESAEPREVHHFALLLGYGAGCINPYLALDAVGHLFKEGELSVDLKEAKKNYIKSVNKGILKVLSKMGISTIQSYRGAQIFEALGLSKDLISRCFPGTVSRVGGATMDTIARETLQRHRQAFASNVQDPSILSPGGLYQWRKDGEFHLWNPDSISALQDAVRNNEQKRYDDFAKLINDQSGNPATLRSLLKFKKATPIPIEEVEPAEDIFKRFATGAMSFGSISAPAHETIAIAMNRLCGRSNTGEGGEDPARFRKLPNGDSKRSSIKQIASGRFGVTTNYLVNADEIQIKIAQGAKPGEGGQLPGHKVSVTIAKTRYTTPGVTLISPPPHHDIYSIEDLAQLIFDLKNTNPRARISVKLVSEIGVGTVAAGVAKGHADMILISGGDGGTGASPLSSIKHAGLPWELGLSEAHQTLVLNNLRGRVRLQTDGQLRTGRDVAIAAMLGAEEFGFATAVLITLGCVMLRHCHLNNCSLGVATQDELLSKRFQGKPEYVENYFRFLAGELRKIMSELGMRRIEDMVGRADLLEINQEILPWKAGKIDFSRILYKPEVSFGVSTHSTDKQESGVGEVLDRQLIKLSASVFEKKDPVNLEFAIKNTNRTTGAMLSGQICRAFGEDGLPDDTVHVKFKGIAGQSFGAWLAKGVTFELEGMCNDYVGKGISGGRIIVYPDKASDYNSQENIIIGNTTFYGAISGEAYIRGVAGERFCIRNSGLYAVVEGVGDHGCEYMTGGRVVVLGKTGRNFAAGMSGGIAYVYDPDKDFAQKCNLGMVETEKLSAEDEETVKNLLLNHFRFTASPAARRILDDFNKYRRSFVKVMPVEYKRILEASVIEKLPELGEYSDG